MRRWLLQVARSPLAGRCISWIITHMSWLIPAKRLRETDTLLAFYHPQPAYPVHILLLPKREIAGLTAVQLTDIDFLLDLMQTVQSLVTELALETRGYRLIANGGAYQDVPHLHFHLIAED